MRVSGGEKGGKVALWIGPQRGEEGDGGAVWAGGRGGGGDHGRAFLEGWGRGD